MELLKCGQKLYQKLDKKKAARSLAHAESKKLIEALPRLERELTFEPKVPLRLLLHPKRGENVLYKTQPKIRLVAFTITLDQIQQLKTLLHEKYDQGEFYLLGSETVLICRYQCWIFIVPLASIDDYDTWRRRDASEFATVYHDFVRPPLVPRYNYYYLWNNNPKNDKHARGKIIKHVSLLYDGKTSKGQPLKNLNTLSSNFSAGELVLIELNHVLRPYIAVIPIYDDLNKQIDVLEAVVRYYGTKQCWEEWDTLLNKMYDLYTDIITTENTFFISRKSETEPQIAIDEQRNLLYKYCINRQNKIRFNLIASSNYPHPGRLSELPPGKRDIFYNLELTNGKNKIRIEWEEFANKINSRHTMEIPAKKEKRAYIRHLVNRVLNFYSQSAQDPTLLSVLVERGFYVHNNFVGSITTITEVMFTWALSNKSFDFAKGWKALYENNDETLESGLFGREFLENIQLLEEMHGMQIRNESSMRADRRIISSYDYRIPVPLYIQTPNDRRALYKRFESYLLADKCETVKRLAKFVGIRVDGVEEFYGNVIIYVVEDISLMWIDKIRCIAVFEAGDIKAEKYHLLRLLIQNNMILHNLFDTDNVNVNLNDLVAFLDNNTQPVFFDEPFIDLPFME